MPNWGPGSEIDGRYRLQQLLGRGGMGEVWRAEHLTLHSPVAVKLIDPKSATDEGVVRRFMQEARAAAGLQSPHVVRTTDFGVVDNTPFLVMELLNGETLAQRLARQTRLTPAETARVIRHVARAVGTAHDAGFVHRDLKPDNIFIVVNDDEELVKVLDFGIAKAIAGTLEAGAKTRTGALLGTPYYMSPEQAQGDRSVDSRADLWSMGVIAFECLTGQRPFESEGLGSLVMQICAGPIPVPSEVAPVPPGFDEWFACAVCRDPAGRFGSARELAAALHHVLVPTSQWPMPSADLRSMPLQSLSAHGAVAAAGSTTPAGAAAQEPAPAPGLAGLPQPSSAWQSTPSELGQTTGGAGAGVITVPMHKSRIGWLAALGAMGVLGVAAVLLLVFTLVRGQSAQPESASGASAGASSAPSTEQSAKAPVPPASDPMASDPMAPAAGPVLDAGAPPAKPPLVRPQGKLAKPVSSPQKDSPKAPPTNSKNRLGF